MKQIYITMLCTKICYFAMNFILAVKIPFTIQRGGMKKVNKNIFLFVDPVTRVLANGNRTIETVTKRYVSQIQPI